jgi:ABC-2 type transport system permease protein
MPPSAFIFPKFAGTIYEVLSAPISPFEIVIAYVGAAASKSIVLGLVILTTASLFVLDARSSIPIWMIVFLIVTALTFSLFGFIIGTLGQGLRTATIHSHAGRHAADVSRRRLLFHRHAAAGMARLQPIQSHRVPDQRFRWCFYGVADVNVVVSFSMTAGFMVACLLVISWIFKTGYRLKN